MVATRIREGATSVLVLTVVIGGVVAGVGQSGEQSINPAEGAFIPPPARIVTVIDDDVVVVVIAELGSMIFEGDVVMMGAGMLRRCSVQWRMHRWYVMAPTVATPADRKNPTPRRLAEEGCCWSALPLNRPGRPFLTPPVCCCWIPTRRMHFHGKGN